MKHPAPQSPKVWYPDSFASGMSASSRAIGRTRRMQAQNHVWVWRLGNDNAQFSRGNSEVWKIRRPQCKTRKVKSKKGTCKVYEAPEFLPQAPNPLNPKPSTLNTKPKYPFNPVQRSSERPGPQGMPLLSGDVSGAKAGRALGPQQQWKRS